MWFEGANLPFKWQPLCPQSTRNWHHCWLRLTPHFHWILCLQSECHHWNIERTTVSPFLDGYSIPHCTSWEHRHSLAQSNSNIDSFWMLPNTCMFSFDWMVDKTRCNSRQGYVDDVLMGSCSCFSTLYMHMWLFPCWAHSSILWVESNTRHLPSLGE